MQATFGTPETVQYNPAPADVKDGQDAASRAALDFDANKEGVTVDEKVSAQEHDDDAQASDDDGLSSPVPSVMRESTQAITPIIHASG